MNAGGTRGTLMIPAGALPTRNPVRVEMTVLDPSQKDVAATPGGDLLAAVAPNPDNESDRARLESMGMVEVRITDLETDEVIRDLGLPATLEQRLPELYQESFSAGDIIPLWFYDETDGLWKEDGAGEVFQGEAGDLWLRGQVSHFTWWNWDYVQCETCFKLRLTSSIPLPQPLAIGSAGITYAARYEALTVDSAANGGEYILIVKQSKENVEESVIVVETLGEVFYLKESAPGKLSVTRDRSEALVLKSSGTPYPTCTDLGTYDFDVSFPPAIALRSRDEVCLELSPMPVELTLTASSLHGGTITQVDWRAPDGGSFSAKSNTRATFDAPLVPDTYRVEVEVTDSFGISATRTKEIVVATQCKGQPFMRGDVNSDGSVNIADPVMITNYLGIEFRSSPLDLESWSCDNINVNVGP